MLQMMLPIRILLQDGQLRETIRQSIRCPAWAKIKSNLSKQKELPGFFFFFSLKYETASSGREGRREAPLYHHHHDDFLLFHGWLVQMTKAPALCFTPGQ